MKIDKREASEIYEWWCAMQQGDAQIDGLPLTCFACAETAERIKKYLGKKEVARIKRWMKKNPYFDIIKA